MYIYIYIYVYSTNIPPQPTLGGRLGFSLLNSLVVSEVVVFSFRGRLNPKMMGLGKKMYIYIYMYVYIEYIYIDIDYIYILYI